MTQSLPKIMVAPNGARRTKADHPALPMTVEDVVIDAAKCFKAGADALHAHVRDAEGRHILDAGLYTELLAEMAHKVPDMAVQITTEAVGQYSPAEQIALVRGVKPKMVSVSMAELTSTGDTQTAKQFYAECEDAGVSIQHIIYAPEEVAKLKPLLPSETAHLLFVLGRYTTGQISHPGDLDPFLDARNAQLPQTDWAVCAFGQNETDCLRYAYENSGKVRIGFENNLLNTDGSVAEDNAARIRELRAVLSE